MSQEILRQLQEMAPWHFDVQIAADIRTGDANRGNIDGKDYKPNLIDPNEMRPLLEALYPEGLAGKSLLDCACNAGGYCLLGHDLGAEYCFGFDVRPHWINQAKFLRSHFRKPKDRVAFEVCDLLEFDQRHPAMRFDVCIFKGIFYHLPDPITGIKTAADRTNEVLVLDTAATKDDDDGYLRVVWEESENPMSGVHHLAWQPTGPRVLQAILNWLGFPETRVIYWLRPKQAPLSRIRMIAARKAEFLNGFEARFKGR